MCVGMYLKILKKPEQKHLLLVTAILILMKFVLKTPRLVWYHRGNMSSNIFLASLLSCGVNVSLFPEGCPPFFLAFFLSF